MTPEIVHSNVQEVHFQHSIRLNKMLTFIPGKTTLNLILLLILAAEKVRVYNKLYIDVIHDFTVIVIAIIHV